MAQNEQADRSKGLLGGLFLRLRGRDPTPVAPAAPPPSVDSLAALFGPAPARPEALQQEAVERVADTPAPALTSNLLPAPDQMAGHGWHARDAGEAFAATMPSIYPDAVVMGHRLVVTNDPSNLIVFGLYLEGRVTPGETYVLSASVRIPYGFRGSEVLVMCPGYPALHVQRADLSLSETWQRVWTSVRLADDATGVFVALFVQGEAGDEMHSTAWKLEAGEIPTPYDEVIAPAEG